MNNVYINIGNEKCCFFINVSIFLIKRLEQYPLLHDSVEEFLRCAEKGYYSSGIIVLSQLLNLLKEETPSKRHEIAHEILKVRPSKEEYEKILESFKKAALDVQNKEMSKCNDHAKYEKKVREAWDGLMKLHYPGFQTPHNSSISGS